MALQPDSPDRRSAGFAPDAFAEAMAGLGVQFEAIAVNLDVIAHKMCDECRGQAGEFLSSARQSLDVAGTTLDELGQRFDPYTLIPTRLGDRLNDLRASIGELERAVGIRILLTHDVSEDCVVLSNRELATRITRQLLLNAAQSGASTARIHYRELSESLEVVFADDGRGMPPSEAKTIGLQSVGDPATSSGRGTALIRYLVNRAGGTVAWDARVNIGTWVTIRLHKQGATDGAMPSRWGRSAVPDRQAREFRDDPQQADALNVAGLVHDVSNDLAAVGIHLDLIGGRSCAECQVQMRSTLEGTRGIMETARSVLESIGLRRVPSDYGLVRIKDRLMELEKAIDAMGAAMGLRIELSYEVSDDCVVLLPRESGRQVTRKLIEHAQRAGAERVRIHYQELNNTVEAVFADDGHGMTAEELESLGFAPHGDRAASVQEVALVRQLINRIGGTVFWDSRKNVGTWVTIRLRKHLPSVASES